MVKSHCWESPREKTEDSAATHKMGSQDYKQCPGWQKMQGLASQGSGLGTVTEFVAHTTSCKHLFGKTDNLSPHLEEFLFTESHWF